MLRTLCALAFAVILSSCAGGPDVDLQSRLGVLGIGDPFVQGPWVIAGDREQVVRRTAAVPHQSVPAVRITSGNAPFIVARPSSARLQVMPYLSWTWNLTRTGADLPPAHLLVGFKSAKKSKTGLAPSRDTLPPHDRVLALVWGRSALQRGSFDGSEGDTPRYIVRGGPENTGSWWLETVDLAALYSRAWPDGDPAMTRISFIGVAAPSRPAQSAAAEIYLGGIVLSR